MTAGLPGASRRQHAAAHLLTTLAWTLVVGLAVAGYSQRTAWVPYDIVQREVLGFAAAFAVAGTLTGAAALATYGGCHLASGFGAILAAIILASPAVMRWHILRLTAPNGAWGAREWHAAIDVMRPSVAVGAAAALLASGLVFASPLVARRVAPWKLGIAVAVATSIVGQWALPFVVSHVADQAIPYLRWHHGFQYDDALTGAASGAGTGALCGAIVCALLGQWLGCRAARRNLSRRASERGAPTHSSPIGF